MILIDTWYVEYLRQISSAKSDRIKSTNEAACRMDPLQASASLQDWTQPRTYL